MRARAMAAVALALLALVGCSSSTTSAVGPNTTTQRSVFCADNHSIEVALETVQNNDDLVRELRSSASIIDDFMTNAPADIRADAKTLVDAAHATVAASDARKFTTEPVHAASNRVATYCGQTPATTEGATAAPATNDSDFCRADEKLRTDIAAAAGDAAASLRALKADQSALTTFAGSVTPNGVDQADVTTVSVAANGALNANDWSRMTTPAVVAALARIATACSSTTSVKTP